MKKIQNGSLVRYQMDSMPKGYEEHYPFKKTDTFVYLGDFVQAPGHCIVVRLDDNKIFTGYHTEDFELIPIDEC